MEPKLLTAERFVDSRTGIAYRYVHSDTEYFRPHYHDYCEIFLVLEGSAKHLVGERVVALRPRDLVFIRPSDVHDYVSMDGQRFSMLNITFTWDTLQELFDFLGDGFPADALLNAPMSPSVHLTGSEFEEFNSRMTAISATSLENAAALKTSLRILLFDAFTRYFSDYTGGKKNVPAWLESVCSQIEKGGEFIEGSERLFALADRSREHVCRSMKKYMGVTVSEYINDLRLRYIANMLRSSNHSVTQIVFESGFNNLSWAAELFRRRYGVSMNTFRRQWNK